MSISYKTGNILDVDCGVIVHGVNCRGIMGAGIALAIKKMYPDNYQFYLHYCKCIMQPAAMLGTVLPFLVNNNLCIANIFSQDYPGPFAEISYIEMGLNTVFKLASIRKRSIHSVKIGCGIGGLAWNDVKLIFEQLSEQYDVDVTIWSL